jgi:homoserine acetyltransferase
MPIRTLPIVKSAIVVIALCIFAGPLAAQQLKFASLGNLQLESGQTIRNLRIGYRTIGKLNSRKSNVVIFPTWFTGTTKQLLDLVGPGKLVTVRGTTSF